MKIRMIMSCGMDVMDEAWFHFSWIYAHTLPRTVGRWLARLPAYSLFLSRTWTLLFSLPVSDGVVVVEMDVSVSLCLSLSLSTPCDLFGGLDHFFFSYLPGSIEPLRLCHY
jgi:hypothetical protein